MSLGEVGFVVAVLFFGGFVKGSIGFGTPLVAVPFLALFFAPRDVVVLLSLPILMSNYAETIRSRAHWRSLRLIALYLAVALVFIPAGVWYLKKGDPNLIRLMMGLMAYAFLILQRRLPPAQGLSRAIQRATGAGMGALLGFIYGATSISGAINTIYFTMLELPKGAFIFAMNAVNSIGMSVLVLALASQGAYTGEALSMTGGALVPVFAGYWAGIRMRERIDQALFFRLIRGTLFLIATSLIVRFALGG